MSRKPQGMLFKKRIALAIERERRDQRRKAQAFQRRYVALLPKDPIKPEDKR